MQEMIISQDQEGNKIVTLVENGNLVEKYEETVSKQRLEGNIYLRKSRKCINGNASSLYRYRRRKKYFYSY